MSFFRSKGERGADVLTLRGKTGANFEGKVRVTRGSEGCFSCFGNIGSSEQDKERYVLIKGSNLFVFLKEDSAAPKYAVDLARKVVNVHPASGQCQMVCLETALGDTEYQFKFDLKENPESANDFAKALKEQIHVADAEAAKARLGHKIKHSKSIKYATNIASKKKSEAPEAPVSFGEAIQSVPMSY
jgi:hypothetical protein